MSDIAERIEVPGLKQAIKEIQNFRKEVNDSTRDLLKNIKESENLAKSFSSIDSLKKLSDFLNGLNGATSSTAKSTNDLTDAQKRLLAANRNLNIALSKEAEAIAKTRVETNRLNKNSRELATISSKLSTEYEKQSTTLNRLRRRLKDLDTQQELGTKLTKEQRREYRKLTREVGRLDTALKNVDARAGQFQRNVGNYPKLLGGINRSVISLARSAGILGGAFAGFQVLRDAARTVIEFDKGLIAVGKTTDRSGKDLQDLGKDIRDLGLELEGISIQGLLGSAEISGTLGAKSSEEILKFSKTIEQLKLTSDIVGEDSVRNLGKFITVSGVGFENADKLGSAITDLGNNFATTENQVLSNSTEIQKGISIYNTSESSVLALGAATSALGLQAEQARSGIQSTLLVLEDAANGGEALTDVLRITGLTQGELSNQFKNDATGVFNQFVKGLSDINKAGGSVTKELKTLDLENKQSINTLGALSKRYEILEKATNRSTKAYRENTALTKEVEAAAESIASRIGDVGDAWDDFILSVDSGDGIISNSFKNLLNVIEGAIEGLKILNATEKERIKIFAKSTASKVFKEEQQDIRVQALLSGKVIADQATQRADEIADQIESLKNLQKQRRTAAIEQKEDLENALKDLEDSRKDLEDQSIGSLLTDQGPSIAVREFEDETEKLKESIKELNVDINEGEGLLLKLNNRLEAAEGLQKDLADTITKETNTATKEQIELTDKQRKALEKLLKQQAKDAFTLAKQRLKFQIDANKSIIDDENASNAERLRANNNFITLSKDLIELESDFAKSNAKGRQDEITRITEQAENDRTKLTAEAEGNREKIFTDSFNRILDDYESSLDKQELALERSALELEAELLKQGKSRQEIEEEITEFLRKEREKQIKIQLDALKTELLALATNAEARKAIMNEIAALENELLGISNDRNADNAEATQELAERTKEAVVNTFNEIGNALNEIYARRIDQIDQEIEAVNEAEEQRLDNFTGTEEQKQAIEDSAEAKRQQLEQKKREELKKQAVAQKALSLFNIVVNTAEAIAEASPNPVLIALAAAQGAIQSAVVASQPIPAFAEGTEYKPTSGNALVGEIRSEVIMEPNKKPYIVDKPTVLDLPQGTKVIPSLDEFNKRFISEKPNLIGAAMMASIGKENDQKALFDAYLGMSQEVKSIPREIKSGLKNLKVINNQKSNSRFERISNKINY